MSTEQQPSPPEGDPPQRKEIVRVDTRRRVTLPRHVEPGDWFFLSVQADGSILLVPGVVVPLSMFNPDDAVTD